mgnify:CR=1 FL=1
MKVSIIGGTGFVGSYIVDKLCGDGHEVQVLTRPGSEHKVQAPAVSVPGSVSDEASLRACLEGADALAVVTDWIELLTSNAETPDPQ